MLLACVVKELKKLCYETCGLDGTQYFTNSHLSVDVFIKICRVDLHLLADRENLEMAEHIIQGGVASVFSKQFFRANKKYMNSFNPDDESNFGLLLDANILYDGVMQKLSLPLKGFQKVEIHLQSVP